MSASKAKGTAFESAVVAYLREHGHPSVERRALAGNKDKGDLAGLVGWTCELKSLARWSPASVLTEAKVEARNAGTPWFAAIVKRRRSPGSTGAIEDAYVLMPLSVFAEVIGQ